MSTQMNDMPLVSVCIPTYNASHTIYETLKGVINQTYKNLDIVVCDNQSTDNTFEIIQQFKDERIRLYQNNENYGMVENFNIVLSKAEGVYVKLLCADDIITEDAIEKQVNVFLSNENQQLVMVASEKKVIDEKGKQLFIKRFPGKMGVYEGEKVIRKSFRHGTNIFGEPGSVLFLTKAIQRAGKIKLPLELTYVVDLQLYIQILKQGNLYVLKEPLFSFRVSRHSYTAQSKWMPAKVFHQFRKKLSNERTIEFSFLDKILAFTMSWVLCVARNIIFTFTNKK